MDAFREQAKALDQRIGQSSPLSVSKDARLEIVGNPDERHLDDDARDEPHQDYRSYVAILPRRESTLQLDGSAWNISHKISITSCSLQDNPGRSKLWVSIEGIPLAQDKPGISAYLDLLSKNEHSALAFFGTAFKDSPPIGHLADIRRRVRVLREANQDQPD